VGENKENENEQKGQGGPNPWIYDVSKVNPGQQYEPQPPSYGLSPMNPYGAPQQARRRGLLILWITLIVLVLLIAVSILILILIVR
jgi:hypothetical protein